MLLPSLRSEGREDRGFKVSLVYSICHKALSQKTKTQMAQVAHNLNPSTQEAGTRGSL